MPHIRHILVATLTLAAVAMASAGPAHAHRTHGGPARATDGGALLCRLPDLRDARHRHRHIGRRYGTPRSARVTR